tara:strand:- start:2532 stop:2732 length:201 start_codon:yes stop_codon:yes gene_type:complete
MKEEKPELPSIRIVSETPIKCVEIGLDMDDGVFETLMEFGKREIVKDEQTLFEYGFRKAMLAGMEK